MAKYGELLYGSELYGMSQPTNAGTGTAGDATAAVLVAAGLAAGTGTARPAAIPVGAGAGTGTAYDAAISLKPGVAGVASGTGTARNAAPTNATVTNVNGGHAAGTGTAYDTVQRYVSAGNAAGTGTAGAPSVWLKPAGGRATGTGTARPAFAEIPTPPQSVNARLPAGVGTAHDAQAFGTVVELPNFVAIVSALTGQPRYIDVDRSLV